MAIKKNVLISWEHKSLIYLAIWVYPVTFLSQFDAGKDIDAMVLQ
jgi:hypothetical protein